MIGSIGSLRKNAVFLIAPSESEVASDIFAVSMPSDKRLQINDPRILGVTDPKTLPEDHPTKEVIKALQLADTHVRG